MGSSGGGGTTISKTEPPSYVKPYAIDMMNRAGSLSTEPYRRYRGQQLADINPQQQMGLGMMQDRAFYGDPLTRASQQMGLNTMAGQYMPSQQSNPFLGVGVQGVDNSYIKGLDYNQIQEAMNPYTGANPHLESSIDAAQSNITKHYQDVTRPQLDSLQVTQGAFGNSGLAQAKSDANANMASALGDVERDMRFADYRQRAQLAENAANRNIQSQMANQAMKLNQAQMAGAQGQFNAGLRSSDLARNAQLMQQGNLAERANQLSLAGLSPTLANQSYNDARMMMGVGDFLGDRNQQQLNLAQQEFGNMQQWPLHQMDILQNALRTTMGGGQVNTVQSPGPSRMGNMLGGGLLGYGVGQQMNSPWLGAAGGAALGYLG